MKTKNIILIFPLLLFLLFVYSSPSSLSRFVTNVFRNEPLILIDPGHGGSDPGKVGPFDLLEKDINLQIAKKLKKKLEKRKFKVKLTRTGDYNLSTDTRNEKRSDLDHRKKIIFSENPFAVISIHQNSYPRADINGAQVFYYSGFEESKILADSIQASFKQWVDSTNHRISKANTDYYLLRDNPYPTVIVECGFLSNREEAQLLMTEKYQQKVANAICHGVLECANTLVK